MPLNLQNNFIPHVRWMAQTSTWRKSAPEGQEIVEWEHAIFDLANIQTGWAIFTEGEVPEWILDPSLDTKAPKPTDGGVWRRGFKVTVYSDSALDGAREFATTAVGAVKGMTALYNQYEQDVAQHPYKVPVVKYVIRSARTDGNSLRKIAEQVGTSLRSVQRVLES
jgi:hypothetical protein